MKRVYQPYGSPRAKQAAKRIRQAPAPTYRRKYLPRSANAYSAFQKVLELKERTLMILVLSDYCCYHLTISVLNDVAQGSSAITRIGRKFL